MTWVDPRTGLAVHRPLQRRTVLRRRSLKRAAMMRAYVPEMLAFLAEHTTCEHPTNHPDGPVAAVCVHHRKGRAGEKLRDQRYWAASCWPCNQAAEDDTGAALACGWLLPIEGVAS